MQATGLTKQLRAGRRPGGPPISELARRRDFSPWVGDNGCLSKSTLIKALAGALIVRISGQVYLDGEAVRFSSPLEARLAGIETVYQELAVAAQLDIAQNMFLGRELRKPGVLGSVLRQLDKKRMLPASRRAMHDLGVRVQSIRQPIETLPSGGQRQAVAVARAAAWGRKVVMLDEPTAALGVRETHQVLDLIRRVRDRGLRRADQPFDVGGFRHRRPHPYSSPGAARRTCQPEDDRDERGRRGDDGRTTVAGGDARGARAGRRAD